MKTIVLSIIFYFIFFSDIQVFSQNVTPSQIPVSKISSDKMVQEKQNGFPVVFKEEPLFWVYTGTDTLTAEKRAKIITSRLKKIAENPDTKINGIRLLKEKDNISIYADNSLIMTITEQDAYASGLTRQQLGHNYSEKVEYSLKKIREDFNFTSLITGIAFTILATIVLFILLKVINYLFPKIYIKIDNFEKNNKILSLKIQKLEIFNAQNIIEIIKGSLRFLQIILVVLLLYIYIPLVLGFFPWTRGFADTLFGYITTPFFSIFASIIAFIPNLFNIAIIIVVSYYLIKFFKLIFRAIENKTLSIPGFHEDWTETTYKISRFLIIAFAAVMIFPYLPGSNSPAFQGISVFIGLLISFGSSSAISNVVAGIVLTYTNSFKIGDRIKIADTVGDIVEKNLLVTRLRTIKNVDITIPNSIVLNSHITNYTSSSLEKGLILNTTVTIGYDVPWLNVHKALISAAEATGDILAEPKPYVFQTSLDDFYVSYEINAFTNNSHYMARIYSELHQNIQDKFNEADIEILSPHYRALRDGNMVTLPPNYLNKDYITPSFRINNINAKKENT